MCFGAVHAAPFIVMEMYFKKAGSDEPFMPLSCISPIKVNCLAVEGRESYWDNAPLTFEVGFKWSKKDMLYFRRLFAKRRVPRKTKKAIKKQCPGITPSEIQSLLWSAKFRRIKHREK